MPDYCSCIYWTPGSSGKGPMKYDLPVLPSCCLLRCFLGIGSLVFTEFRHFSRKAYQVVRGRAGFFGKTFFVSKNWGNGPKISQNSFLNLKKNLIIFPWICSIMKICYLLYSGRCRPKCSQSFRSLNFYTNHFSWINGCNSPIFCMLIHDHINEKLIILSKIFVASLVTGF